ncbi:hypothetical protein FE257_005987 [Aspergillus nanangensis]|uniref:DUF292 domain protein n=1 Tax=Aspergillus nanangensis TaxID=2582783 RepID=A0AAD4GV22_ASPNN|nr:hypothetical protein FE257_005987 [Aspergillus nanangensis]
MPPSPQTAKLTSTLHLLIPRLRLLQKKSTASSVVQRRELSHLLSEGRDASARIRVENVIATDISIEVMEMVELYCELLLARSNVLDQLAFAEKGVTARNHARDIMISLKKEQQQQHSSSSTTSPPQYQGTATTTGGLFSRFNPFGSSNNTTTTHNNNLASSQRTLSNTTGTFSDDNSYLDTALDEAAAAIFYAWSRFPHDVRELTMLRGLLADRYGKDFMTLAQDNKFPAEEGLKVPERLVKGLRVRPPTQELVDSYLREIARAYGIAWGEEENPQGEVPATYDYDDEGLGGGGAEGGDDAGGDLPSTPGRKNSSDPVELNRATPPRGLVQSGKSPVSVAPPGPRPDNPNPRVKVPDGTKDGAQDGDGAHLSSSAASASKAKGGIPELDELTKRFAALKK